MNENKVEQIENYLSGNMSSEEKNLFETELTTNGELYALLNVYKTIGAEMYNMQKYDNQDTALKNTLQKLNDVYFKAEAPVVSINSNKKFIRIAMSAAAGLVLILTAYYTFFQSGSDTAQLADRYVKNQLTHLSQTMDGARDSLQQGIAAYNNQDYSKAIQLFEALHQNHPENSDALKYAGTAYLVTKSYDKALERFDTLAGRSELFSNSGMFLKAVTLLQRNKQGDKKEAEQLLLQVVNEKADGSKEAAKWLNK